MTRTFIALLAALSLGACATSGAPRGPGAPQPRTVIDPARFYTGTWYEIGRRPMAITRGCVAATTTYTGYADGRVQVRDTCLQGGPDGPERAIGGPGRILDPGTFAKLRVRYLGIIPWDFWVLEIAPDYSWFISADPTFTNLFLYTRDPHPSAAVKGEMLRRASALGYDVLGLEFPDEIGPS